jgi:hypothetical protein
MLAALALSGGCGPSPDESDWLAAQKANTADSYITYLVGHPQGAFMTNARSAARKLLTVNYTELPEGGEVVKTNGLEDIAAFDVHSTRYAYINSQIGHRIAAFDVHGESPIETHVTDNVMQDGVRRVFDENEFQVRVGNTIFQPRFAGASFFFPTDPSKGVIVSDFDVCLRGTAQSVPISRY